MKNIFKKIQEFFSLLQVQEPVDIVQPTPPQVPEKTQGEKFYEFCMSYYNTDPTPLDTQDDAFACAEVMSTLLNKFLGDFPVVTYTPVLLENIRKDKRFREIKEFKKGAIIISPTGSGNGKIIGHTGTLIDNGKILSNLSDSGLFTDKYDHISWINRYSKSGQLDIHLFELV